MRTDKNTGGTIQGKSVRKNFMMNALLAMSSFVFPIITFPYVSRVLGPAGTGRVSFATSVIAYFSMFAQLGIPTYGIRACAKVRDDREALTRTAHELLGINLAMDALSYLLLALALLVVPRLAADRTLIVIISATVLLNSIGMEWLYKALEQYAYITLRSIAFKLVALAAMFMLIHAEGDYVVYGGISIFAASASNLLNFANARRYIDLRRPRDCDWRRHVKPVMIFFGMSCAATVYTNLDALMLGFMTTDVDVGYYNAAVKIKNILVSIVTALGAVLLPRFSYYVEHGRMDEFRRMAQKALRFVLVFASALSLYFMIFSPECILFLSGDAFMGSIEPMRFIMPTVLFIGLSNVLGMQILVPLGHERLVLKSEVAGVIVDLILNALLIPRFRATGAAIGTLVAEAAVLAVQYRALRGEVGAFFRTYAWGRLVVGLAVAVAAGCWVKYLSLGPFASLAISALCFFSAYALFMLWRRDEIVSEVWGQAVERGKRLLDRGRQ